MIQEQWEILESDGVGLGEEVQSFLGERLSGSCLANSKNETHVPESRGL